jgi:ABC-2 type transport system permease protein
MKFWQRVLAVMQKEILHVLRDRVAMLIAFVAPFFLTVLFGYIYIQGTVNGIPMAVFDQDQTEISRTIIRSFKDSNKFKLIRTVNSYSELERLMDTEHAYIGVVIPNDLQKKVKTGQAAEVGVMVNGANLVIYNMAATSASQVIQTISAKVTMQVMEGAGISQDKAYKAVTALSFRQRTRYSPSASYLIFMLLGLICTVIQQVTMLGVALSFSKEREYGNWRQLALTRLRWSEYVLGKLLVYFLIYLLDAVITFALGFLWFKIPMRGDVLLLLWITVIFIVVLVVMGLMISAFCKSVGQAIELSMVIAMPSFLVSGYTFPLMGMPPLIQAIAKILPLTYYLEAVRSVAYLGNGMEAVAPKIGILLLFALLCLPVMLVVMKRKMELAK